MRWRDGVRIFITAAQSQPMRVMDESGLVELIGRHKFCTDIDDALTRVREVLAAESGVMPH